jgi:hypothetical protein
MTENSSSDGLETLVATHLERHAAAVDVRHILAQVKRKSAAPWFQRSKTSSLRWMTAVAACFLLVLATGQAPTAKAAEETLRQAQEWQDFPVDRAYRLTVTAREGWPAWMPKPLAPFLIWTRGHAFFVQSTLPGLDGQNHHWVWGRNPRGELWIAFDGNVALRFAANSLPEPLAQFLSIRSADFHELLVSLLQHCELKEVLLPGGISRIIAKPRAEARLPFLQQATVEVESDTGALRQLEIERVWRNRPSAILHLERVEGQPKPSSGQYEAGGHLQPGAVLYGPEQSLLRARMLLQHLGRPQNGGTE